MNFTDLDSHLLKYDSNSNLILRKLSSSSTDLPEDKRSYFCLIPYVNPARQKINCSFYEVDSVVEIEPVRKIEAAASIVFKSLLSKQAYIDRVKLLKKEIQLGNIYEINFCTEFIAESEIDPVQVFERLHQLSQAPYACLVKLKDEYIISASPELFLKKEGATLITKPIKGTAKRGRDESEDNILRDELQQSIKERTENVMAVDVARNDLSRLAARGSVKVNKLYNIETYETVHQMVSTISCGLKEHTSLAEILNATFPMASMTGAPKISAMKYIDIHEGFKRNYYSGAMGMIGENGDFELSVNIRCIFYNAASKKISIAVGSAITHLSDPESEYRECLLKADALLRALNGKIS